MFFSKKSTTKKILLVILFFSVLLLGCDSKKEFSKDNNITVLSREEGSGTRGAF